MCARYCHYVFPSLPQRFSSPCIEQPCLCCMGTLHDRLSMTRVNALFSNLVYGDYTNIIIFTLHMMHIPLQCTGQTKHDSAVNVLKLRLGFEKQSDQQGCAQTLQCVRENSCSSTQPCAELQPDERSRYFTVTESNVVHCQPNLYTSSLEVGFTQTTDVDDNSSISSDISTLIATASHHSASLNGEDPISTRAETSDTESSFGNTQEGSHNSTHKLINLSPVQFVSSASLSFHEDPSVVSHSGYHILEASPLFVKKKSFLSSSSSHSGNPGTTSENVLPSLRSGTEASLKYTSEANSLSAPVTKEGTNVHQSLYTEMAGRAHAMPVYPSPNSHGHDGHSSGTMTAVPHHSLITTSAIEGSDSPPLPRGSPRRTLYIVPARNGEPLAQTTTEATRPLSYTAVHETDKEDSDLEGVDITLVLLPGEKHLGVVVAGNDQVPYPHVQSIERGRYLLHTLHVT